MEFSISVLIVTWNSGSYIRDCLQSLVTSTGCSLEIIVIDNCSSDGTVDVIGDYPCVELFVTSANWGFAPAMNIALRRAKSRFLCMLNPDTIVSPRALNQLANFLEQNESVSAVGPTLLDDKGKILPTCARSFPSLNESFVRQFGLARMFPNLFDPEKWTRPRSPGRSPLIVPAISGAALMLRRTVFEKVGLLDETIPMYFEDLDYCARLCRRGPVCYLPDAVVNHSGAKSASVAPARKLLYAMEEGEAPFLYFRRYRGYIYACLFVAITFLGSIFRLCLLFPTLPLKVGRLRVGPKLQRLWSRAEALLWWALSPRTSVEAQIRLFFGQSGRSPFDRAFLLTRQGGKVRLES